MNNPLIMHINYCEQGQTVDEACKKAAAWGADGIEFRRASSVLKYASPEKYLDDIAAAMERHRLKHVVFGSPTANLIQTDRSAREKEVAEAMKFFGMAAKKLPLSVVNALSGGLQNPAKDTPPGEYEMHGSFIATDEQWGWVADGFKALGKFAEENKFKFAFETHMYYLHDTPQAAKKLCDMIGSPAVGVNLDYGNAVYFKPESVLPLPKTIETLGKSMFYLHLKNSVGVGKSRLPTSLSEGEINHREYLRLARDAGFKGPICVEAPRPGDREWYAAADITYARALMSEL